MQTLKLETVVAYKTQTEGVLGFDAITSIIQTKDGVRYGVGTTGDNTVEPSDIVQAYRPVGRTKRPRNARPRTLSGGVAPRAKAHDVTDPETATKLVAASKSETLTDDELALKPRKLKKAKSKKRPRPGF